MGVMGDPLIVLIHRDVDGYDLIYERACCTDTLWDLDDIEHLQPGTLVSMEIVG